MKGWNQSEGGRGKIQAVATPLRAGSYSLQLCKGLVQRDRQTDSLSSKVGHYERERGSCRLCPNGGVRPPRGRENPCWRILNLLGGGRTGMPPASRPHPPSLPVKTEVQSRSPAAFLPGSRLRFQSCLGAQCAVSHQNRAYPWFLLRKGGDECPGPAAPSRGCRSWFTSRAALRSLPAPCDSLKKCWSY